MDNVSHPSSKDPFTFIISIQCLMIDYIITNHPFLKFALFQRVSVCSSNVMTCYSLLLGSLQSGHCHCGHWPPSQTGLSLQKQKYFQLRLSNLTLAFGIASHRRLLRYQIGCFADTITVKYLLFYSSQS